MTPFFVLFLHGYVQDHASDIPLAELMSPVASFGLD